MAVLANGLETIDLGSTGWRVVMNTNIENLYTKTEIDNPANDRTFSSSTKGVVLKDRTDGNSYRIYVDNGALGTEVV